MFPPPWSTLPDFVAHDWMKHQGEGTLTEVAAAMCDAAGIRDGDTVVGASLGGMVGCEITKLRRIKRLWLIGSAVHPREISGLLAALHPLAQMTPIEWLQSAASKLPLELSRMFSEVQASFIRAMCPAIFQWAGLQPTETEVLRIHGLRDLVIPPPAQPDLSLDGGHLISITHAADCVAFISRASRVSRAD